MNKLRVAVLLVSVMVLSVYFSVPVAAEGGGVYDWVKKFNRAIFGITGAQVSEGVVVSAASLPDLQPIAITGVSSAIKEGDTVILNSGVKNVGSASADNIGLQWLVDGVQAAYNTRGILRSGESVVDGWTMHYWSAKPGSHTISFVVDPDNTIPEGSESNNYVSVTIDVKQNNPDIAVESISFKPSSPVAGERVDSVAVVKNVGKANANDLFFDYSFICPDSSGATVGEPPYKVIISPSAIYNVPFPMLFDKGTCSVTVVAKATGDSNSANDALTVPVSVKETPACSDSDGGLDYYTYGTASGLSWEGILTPGDYDVCIGSQLAEKYCENNRVKNTYFTCTNGCVDGACLSAPEEEAFCPAKIELAFDKSTYVLGEPYTMTISTYDSKSVLVGSGVDFFVEFKGEVSPKSSLSTKPSGVYKLLSYVGVSDYDMGTYIFTAASKPSCPPVKSSQKMEIIKEAEAKCTDSDGGKDYYVKGTTTGDFVYKDEVSSVKSVTDSCNGDLDVIENYCNGAGYRDMVSYACPYGCSDGACMKEEIASLDLSDYPYPFGNGKDTLIVVGDVASSLEVIAATDIALSFNAAKVKVASEVADIKAENAIVVGAACANAAAADIFNNPTDCTDTAIKNAGMIKIVEHGNGNAALYVAGWNSDDTRRAARVLVDYKKWVEAGKLKGKEVKVTGTSLTDINVLPVETSLPECTDSDGGNDYSVKGVATGWEGNELVTSIDGCSYNKKTLSEVYCSGKYLIVEQHECPNGCKEGACVKEEAFCKDNYKGCSDGSGTYQNYCSGNYLYSASCVIGGSDGCSYSEEPVYCTKGCSNGECLLENDLPPLPPEEKFESTIKLQKGWNLVGRFIIDGTGNVEASCGEENILAAYYYDPVAKRYVDLLGKNDDDWKDQKAFQKFSSFWIKMLDLCEVKVAIDEPYGWIHGKPLAGGWNLLSSVPDMVGHTLDDLSGSCAIAKAYGWEPVDKQWKNIMGEELDKGSVGYGFAVKVVDDCVLSNAGLPVVSPPEFPID